MKIIGVIPARYQSSRLPGKPLADICGKPMIWWTYKHAKKVERLDDVYVATDNEKIEAVCRDYSIPVVMTSTDNPTHLIFDNDTISDNSMLLLIHALINIGLDKVAIAGFDGYNASGDNYVYEKLDFMSEEDLIAKNNVLLKTVNALRDEIEIDFLTPSIFSRATC